MEESAALAERDRRTRPTATIGLVLIVLLASACGGMKLRYQRPPAVEPVRGAVHLVVADARPENRGGDDPLRVGTVRNTFGMPFPLEAVPGREPAEVIRDLVGDCLRASGFGLADAATGASELHASILRFWGDGYQHSRMTMEVALELRRAGGGEALWSHVLDANQGVTWTAGMSQFDRGFTRMLEEAKAELLAELAGDEFARAARAATGAGRAP